ncbi:MAG TPA: DUF3068 domain-containing protein [Jatrophihabitans sp.]|uniref:DUF3068 domain-containing protein n=1 Tax=Jatrophihabitans sp. TaxID=1932789 RepID=UPI002F0AA149
MRKILTAVLIGLGIFSLVLAGLLRFYAPSRVEKAPLDLKVPQQVAAGPAKVYNVSAGKLEDVDLMATRQVVADSAASDSKVAVNQVTLCIVKVIDNPPNCGDGPKDPRIVRVIVDRAPADRETGLAVNDPKYGENIDGTPVKHEGLTYKWPFHAQKTTYKFFDVNSRTPAEARFIGTDKVEGMQTYKYEAVIDKIPLEVAKGVPGLYSDTRVVWVEPRTGAIVNGTQHQVRTTETGTLVFEADLAFTDATIKHQSKLAKDGLSKLKLLDTTLPLILLVVGLLALAGAFLLYRRPAKPGAHEPTGNQPEPAGRL